MNSLKNEEVFIENLLNAFPEIKDELLEEDNLGVVTLQIACFKRFTQKTIDSNDVITLKACLKFVDENIDQVERKIENALYITYLGHLKFDTNKEAKKLLPTRLKSAIDDLANYRNSNPRTDKLKSFLNGL